MITIGIVEDKKETANFLKELIESFDGFTVLFTAYNGLDLIQELKTKTPQLLIMDIQMPKMNGIESVKFVKETYPHIKILMNTVLNNDEAIIESVMLGANGYLLKNQKPQILIDAISDVIDGGAPITPSIATKLIKYINSTIQPIKVPVLNTLTDREYEVLKLIAEGYSYKLISEQLFISSKTVGKHIENIYAKLRVNNKIEAINMLKNKD